MKYLLDTDTLIDFIQDRGNTRKRIAVLIEAGDLIGLCAITVAELQSGVIQKNHRLFSTWLNSLPYWDISREAAAPARGIARTWRNVETVLAEVTGIDAEARVVKTTRQTYSYEYLVMATGAETSYFGNEKWARFADGLKTLEEAVAIRRKVLLSLELAETAQSEEERRRLLTFVLIGAGPTGVEMAGAIADLAKHMLARDFRHIESGTICVILLEASLV